MKEKHEKGWEKPTSSEVAALKDAGVLIEKKLPNVTKLDLTSLDQRQAMKALNDSHNSLIEEVEKLKILMSHASEYLGGWGQAYKLDVDEGFDKLDSALRALERIEKLQSRVTLRCPKCSYTVPPTESKKLNKKELIEQQIRQQKIKDIKTVINDYPEFKDNFKFLQMQSGVHAQTIKKYRREGLV